MMSIIRKKALWLRVGLYSVALIVLGYFLISYWWTVNHRFIDYAGMARAGEPIATAVYRFKQERGLWPEYLDELSPQYYQGKELLYWQYEPGRCIWKSSPVDGSGVRYDFEPGEEGWKAVRFDLTREKLSQPQSKPGPTTLPHDQVIANALAEYDRRIKREPREIDHYRAKAALLQALHRPQDTLAVCRQACDTVPDAWWPRVALEALHATVPDDPDDATTAPADTQPATQAAAPTSTTAPATATAPATTAPSSEPFARWVARHPTFTHWYYLAALRHNTGDLSAAAAALHEALAYPLELSADDPYSASFYAWDAARIAYEARDYALVLSLCDLWEKLGTPQNPPERSYSAMRAAALLAQGQGPQALEQARQAIAWNNYSPLWAQNLSDLEKAAAAGDKTFVYHPGDRPTRFVIFPPPEVSVP